MLQISQELPYSQGDIDDKTTAFWEWLVEEKPQTPPASHYDSTIKDNTIWGRASGKPGWHGSGSGASNGPTLSDRAKEQQEL